ncbi:hypothetical protein DFA_05524 [Cavenderia fasciculata]|uniref:N-acetyltransferase domain-containing protein n=1 Tax=Cavenderia fasciculata TaxID=261658 RepID=F4PLH0_CACFS|nr:uncharacterized protein DFA_05524 [Cavenderia fasciculata]EGG23392.1 hypothetical protein DFA_05524 [Cavenderia fasciculata]|eukprot:XP_004361243.1 hypothetical protein DFA_05524 [Cavenderia fasciculata]
MSDFTITNPDFTATITNSVELIATSFGSEEFKEIKKIRYDVFVVEQKCPEDEEWDEYDEKATHYLLRVNGEAVGCARSRQIYYPDYEGKLDTHVLKLERFAVPQNHRGKNHGGELVKRTIKQVYKETKDKNYPLYIINAQQYVEKFYQKLGFETDQSIPIFYECEIPHVRMIITAATVSSQQQQQ